jgi:NAD(P)H-nitrite reductase large subunit
MPYIQINLKSMKHIVIIGNGIAGITAARHIRKLSDFDITVISSESKYFWSRTALMYIYMGHMRFENTKPYEDQFWEKNRINLMYDHAIKIDTDHKSVELRDNEPVLYDALILATGSSPNFFGWEGESLKGVRGMVSLQDLEYIEAHTKDIKRGVIVGGGLIGVELAEMLKSRDIEVTFLVREKEFWMNVLPEPDAKMIRRHILKHHVDLRLETELDKIHGDEQGHVRSVTTRNGEEIPCQFVGIAAGVSPNITLAKESGIPTDRGILVDEWLQTPIQDVYAIGDCAQRTNTLPGRRAIEQVWYTGRMMGETVAATITGNRTAYQPGPWFNSAKFFDIEYQTYGQVPSPVPETMGDFYWEHEEGEKAMHVVFDKDSEEFLGINTFGIRLRHELFDQWLHEKASVEKVMQHLKEANFDPEFFKDHSEDIIGKFQEKYPDFNIRKKRRKLLGFI